MNRRFFSTIAFATSVITFAGAARSMRPSSGSVPATIRHIGDANSACYPDRSRSVNRRIGADEPQYADL